MYLFKKKYKVFTYYNLLKEWELLIGDKRSKELKLENNVISLKFIDETELKPFN